MTINTTQPGHLRFHKISRTHLATAVSFAGNWFLIVGPLPMLTVNVCSPSCLHTTRYTCWKGPTVRGKLSMLHTATLASYPGLLAPAFITCSTNAGEGLVKQSHVIWHTWTYEGVAQLQAAFWIQETSLRLSDVECSVILRSVFVIGSAIAYLLFFRECATPPYVQVHHTTWLSSTRPSPALVLQVTNAGTRRTGYKATVTHLHTNTF